jgi:hypothetical protein
VLFPRLCGGQSAFRSRLAIVVMLLLGAEREARAFYVDPGSGSLLWQLLVAALLGIRFHFGKWNPFGGRKKEKKEEREE